MLQPIINLLRTVRKCYNLKNTKINHIRIFSPKYNQIWKIQTNTEPKSLSFGFPQQQNKQKLKLSHDERALTALSTFSGSTGSTTAPSLELSLMNLRLQRFDLERQSDSSWAVSRRGFEPSSSINPISRRRRRRCDKKRRRGGGRELQLRRERGRGIFVFG